MAWPIAEWQIGYWKSCIVLSTCFPVVKWCSRSAAKSAYLRTLRGRRHSVKPPLMATFFGGQSIHWLFFIPLYNGHFLLPQGVHCGEASTVFTFSPLNVNRTLRSAPTPVPTPILNEIVLLQKLLHYRMNSDLHLREDVNGINSTIIQPVLLQNLHNCFFLSMLLISYYTTVFRGQSENCWYMATKFWKQTDHNFWYCNNLLVI